MGNLSCHGPHARTMAHSPKKAVGRVDLTQLKGCTWERWKDVAVQNSDGSFKVP